MNPDIEAAARANYEGQFAGCDVAPWSHLRDCEKHRFRLGAYAVREVLEPAIRAELLAAEPVRARVVKLAPPPDADADALALVRDAARRTSKPEVLALLDDLERRATRNGLRAVGD